VINSFSSQAKFSAQLASESKLSLQGYSEPNSEIVSMVDAPRPPVFVVSPNGRGVLIVDIESHPPMSDVSEPVLKLAGIRLCPQRRSRQHLQYGKRLKWVSFELVNKKD